MNLSYTTQDLKRYIELVENYQNEKYSIPIKDLHEYRISYSILNDLILTELESKRALISLERLEKNPTNINTYSSRKEANVFISNKDIRNKVFSLYGKSCLNCGSNYKLALDHIKPICIGGKNTIENLQPLCKNCNSKKGKKIIDYRKACHMF